MDDTSLSLLMRIRQSRDAKAWEQLTDMYTPLLARWLRKYGVQPADVDDLVQEVLTVLSQEISGFEHAGRKGAFRNWLKKVLVYRLYDYRRRSQLAGAVGNQGEAGFKIEELEDPTSSLSGIWQAEHDRIVLQQLLKRVRTDFSPQTWAAFQAVTFADRSADEVATELNMTTNAVFIAKSRVLARLRHEAQGLIDDSLTY